MMTRASCDELAEHGYAFTVAVGGNPDAYPIASSVGSRGAVTLETAYRRGNRAMVRRSLSRWAARLPVAWRLFLEQPAENVFAHLDRIGQTRGRRARRRVSVERAPRPAAMVELLDRLGHDGRLRHVRDHEYLAWRFQNPLSRYRFLFVGESRLEGYLVLQAPAEGLGPAVSIVDWEASDFSIRADLLRAVMEWGRFDELRVWSATLSADGSALLRRAGFRFADSGGRPERAYRPGVARQHASVRAVSLEMRKQADWMLADRRLLDSSNWDLRMIYSDDY